MEIGDFMENILLVKYGEIAMRGKNRYLVENRLISIIIKNLENYGNYRVYKEQGRLLVKCETGEFDYETVIPKVVNILGVVAVCPGVEIQEKNMENIRDVALKHMRKQNGEKKITFKVETKRSDKQFPLDSREVSADIGGFVLNSMDNLTVDVHSPDVILTVELRNSAYVYSSLIKGFGGLPVGSSGKATVLMSGGIDSPVAAFMTAKRGVEIDAVYFDSPPHTSERARQKVIDLAEKLSLYTGKFNLYVVPFTEVQHYLYNNVPPEKITIFLKRAMIKSAEKIALENGSLALITGDSVGQVASQTMQAINSINSAAKELTILRPLCGFDKQEIVDLAKKIDTFEISIRPYEDCCTVFVPKHPETKPKKSIIEKIEKSLSELDDLITESCENKKVF